MDHAPARPAAAWGLGAYSVLRQAADVCQTLAINWYLAASTGSAGLLGLAWVASRLPWAVLPLSGAAADRRSRRRLVVAGDLGLAAVGLAVILAHARIATILFLVVYALGYAAVRPATKGLPREVVANSPAAARLSGLLTTLEYVAILTAQLAAGRWLLPRGPAWGLGAMVAALVLGAAILGRTVPASPPTNGRAQLKIGQVVALLWAPALRGPFLLTVACGGCAFVLLPLAPLLARGASALYALLMAAYSLGGAVGAGLARWIEGWRSGMRGAAIAWLAAVPALALAPRVHLAAVAVACYAVVGVAAGFQDAGNAARVAARIPPEAQSQAMALGSLIWRLPGVVAGAIVALAAPVPVAGLCLVLACILGVVTMATACAPAAARAEPASPIGA